jgi:hypothetical protein
VLLGRLCLYGPGAARLHEEIVPVTARWSDPHIRKGPLKPYAREAETKTLSLLDEAVAKGRGATSDVILRQLRQSADDDVEQLLPHLQTRGNQYADDAEQKLAERAEAEAQAMREILETQKKHIAATAKKHEHDDPKQLRLDFGDRDEELRQLEANKRYWGKRLATIDQELQTEPQRIRDVYQVQARRIEPVGLVYLWPVTG